MNIKHQRTSRLLPLMCAYIGRYSPSPKSLALDPKNTSQFSEHSRTSMCEHNLSSQPTCICPTCTSIMFMSTFGILRTYVHTYIHCLSQNLNTTRSCFECVLCRLTDFGLVKPGKNPNYGVWLAPESTLQQCNLKPGDLVQLRRQKRLLKVKTMDGSLVTLMVWCAKIFSISLDSCVQAYFTPYVHTCDYQRLMNLRRFQNSYNKPATRLVRHHNSSMYIRT